jgi:CHAD domain-containing protein
VAKAWDVPGLGPTSKFRDAAGRVILTRWFEMMSRRDATLRGDDHEDLHAMRVSSRRLRAAMDAFEGTFPKKSFRPFVRQVKEITSVLGASRDLDVAIVRLTALAPTMADEARPGVDGLVARYRDARAAETGSIAELFDRLDRDHFERRLVAYVTKHTGVRMDRFDPGPRSGRAR